MDPIGAPLKDFLVSLGFDRAKVKVVVSYTKNDQGKVYAHITIEGPINI
jgi:hypothetical protein